MTRHNNNTSTITNPNSATLNMSSRRPNFRRGKNNPNLSSNKHNPSNRTHSNVPRRRQKPINNNNNTNSTNPNKPRGKKPRRRKLSSHIRVPRRVVSSLSISAVTEAHEGTYMCVATSRQGSVSQSVTLSVIPRE